MITLDLKIPENLKHEFNSELKHSIVHCDLLGKARDTMLVWLWSRTGDCVWISEKPLQARDRLFEILALYPRLHTSVNRIKWLKPSEVTVQNYDYAVLEELPGATSILEWVNVAVKQQWRVLEQTKVTIVKPNFNNYSLDEQIKMLDEIRAGSKSLPFNEYDLVESITTADLYFFVKEYWSEIIPEAFIDNWHIKYLCNEIQIVFERVFNDLPKLYDLVINISPGESKSSIASVFAPAWVWKRMPSLRFIGGSYVHRLAADLSRKTRDVILSQKYQRCMPMSLREDQNAKDYYVNDNGGMRLAVGTGGVAGFHAHAIVIDDPLDPNKSASTVELNAANAWICNSLAQRKIDQSKTPIILIMQRLHQNDPTAAMLKRALSEGGGAVKHICLPAEISDNINPPELKQFYVNGLMDPHRLSQKTLNEKKAQGQFFYSGQYEQRPTPLGGAMFKWERIKFDVPPAMDKIQWKIFPIRYWDKAGTQDAGCRTAGVLMGLDIKLRVWILDVIIGQWDSARREEIIKSVAILDGHNVKVFVEQEPGSAGKESAENTIRNLIGYSCTADKPTGDKILRADPFSAQVNMGNVYMKAATWNFDYLEELQYFPNSTFKDQVDASSGAFKMLTRKQLRVGAL